MTTQITTPNDVPLTMYSSSCKQSIFAGTECMAAGTDSMAAGTDSMAADTECMAAGIWRNK